MLKVERTVCEGREARFFVYEQAKMEICFTNHDSELATQSTGASCSVNVAATVGAEAQSTEPEAAPVVSEPPKRRP